MSSCSMPNAKNTLAKEVAKDDTILHYAAQIRTDAIS